MVARRDQLRRLHRVVAPIMLLPILLTVVTGSLYQMADLSQKGGDFFWLLELHVGHFGPLHLEGIYPFLNALGLLTLAITGFSLWLKSRPRSRSST